MADSVSSIFQPDEKTLVVKPDGKFGRIGDVSFVIGAEVADVINVAVQLLRSDGLDLAEVGQVRAFLSDNVNGLGISAGAPDAGVAIGTDGAILAAVTAGLFFELQSEVDGDIDLDIDESGIATWYLVIILPCGKKVVSDAITFA